MAAESCKREETGLAAAMHRVQGSLDIHFHRLGTPWIPDAAAVVIIYSATKYAAKSAGCSVEEASGGSRSHLGYVSALGALASETQA